MKKIKMQRMLAIAILTSMVGTVGLGVSDAIVEYQNKLDIQVSVIDEQSLKIKELESTIERLEEENIELNVQLDSLNSEKASLETINLELVGSIENLNLENEELKKTTSINEVNSVIQNDINILYRIARAEAGDWDKQAIKDVVYVILNRVYSDEFPNTIEEVVFAKRQFSPVSNGTYYTVDVTQFVIDAVDEACADYEESYKCYGALYFASNDVILGEYIFSDNIHHFYR